MSEEEIQAEYTHQQQAEQNIQTSDTFRLSIVFTALEKQPYKTGMSFKTAKNDGVALISHITPE